MSGIYESIPAAPEEVEVFGAGLTEAHLHCRVWGHDPDPQGNVRLATDDDGVPGAYWVANPGCTHGCGVRWLIYADAEGWRIKRTLDYSAAPDYLSEHGRIDKQGRAILTREYFVRAVGDKPRVKRVAKKSTKTSAKKGKR